MAIVLHPNTIFNNQLFNPMNKLNKLSNYLLILFLVAGLFSSCKKDTPDLTEVNSIKNIQDNDIISNWNDALLEIERFAAGYRPCPVARATGYIGFASYETALPAMPDYRSIAGNYPGLSIPAFDKSVEVNFPLAINATHAYLFKQFFPGDLIKINTTENNLKSKYSQGVSQAVVDASIKWGEDVAKAVYAWAKTDAVVHDAQFDVTQGGVYTESNKPGSYHATPSTDGPGKTNFVMFPKFGLGRVFAISTADRVIPEPIAYSEDPKSQYYGQAWEVYTRTVNATNEDKWIAEFWSDDLLGETFSPPTRWFAIASQVYRSSQCNLEKALVTNFKIGIALNDVVVACWGNKYKYDIERPVTYIRKVIDANWLPILGDKQVTPAFPAYPSGHSTMGGAAAEVLTNEFGIDFALTDRCHEGRTEFYGTPRAFPNFYSMAEENALSRIPLGVHWRMDCTSGVSLGYVIGRKVNKLPIKK